MVFDDREDAIGTLESLSVKHMCRRAHCICADGSMFATRTFGSNVSDRRRSCIDSARTDIGPGTAYVDIRERRPPARQPVQDIIMEATWSAVLQIVVDLSQYNQEISSYIVIAGGSRVRCCCCWDGPLLAGHAALILGDDPAPLRDSCIGSP